MASQNSKIEIEITVDTRDGERNVDRLNSRLGVLGRGLQGVGRLAGVAFRVGLAAATTGLLALGGGIAFAFREAMEAQEVQAQLNAVLRSTGEIAGVSAEMANQLAESLSRITRFSDEAILSGENILLTFTNIGSEVFPLATQAILDMSTALGQDLQSSAIQLGKALQDPILGVTALRRVGVNFSEAQQEVIRSLVESGQLLEAQKMILQELQVEFGGSAQAAGMTFAGQLDILKNSLANIAEQIGGTLIPLFTPFLQVVNQAVQGLQPLIDAFKQFVFNVQNGMSPIEAFRNTFGQFIPEGFQDLFNQVLNLFRTLELTLRDPSTQEALREIGDALGTLISFAATEYVRALAAEFRILGRIIIQAGPAIVTILNAIADVLGFIANNPALNTLASLSSSGDAAMRISGFAEGGFLAPGQIGLVGEKGPELAVGGRQGTTIVPLDGAGGAVTNYYITNPVFNVPNQGTLDGLLREMNAGRIGG